jgi:hypothetical protein
MGFENLYLGRLKLLSLIYYSESDTWSFTFEQQVNIQAECLWRFLKNGKIVAISNDHRQNYGLEKPHDLEKEIPDLLKSTLLLKVYRNTKTGDLSLEFDNNFLIELLTDSSGFEHWNLQIGSIRYIGFGQGEISKIN